jgi:peptidoglycan/xylan/chitin deacetylase (PgdA/CDA1 family)
MEMEIKKSLERDFVGYGNKLPKVEWPNKARIAISIVVNYEEGSEYSLAFGDKIQESSKEYPKSVPEGVRDLTNESVYEYGARAGFWRLMRIFKKHNVSVTFFVCAVALERNLEAARAIAEAGYEVCSHGYRWEEPFRMTEEEERISIRKAVESLKHTTGIRPEGWFGRYGASINTRRLLAEEGGFIYDSDSMAEDIPYYVNVGGQPFLIVPYNIDVNDSKYWVNGAFGHADDFFTYMKDTFDVLYEEGDGYPKMMSIGIHPRISGRPGRAKALERFIGYARGYDHVWFARRIDIARWWLEHYPPNV